LALLAIATLCPIAVLLVFSYLQDRDERRDDEVTDAHNYARGLAARIDLFAQDLHSLTLAASLALGSQANPINQANNQRYLQSLQTQNEALRAIFVTDTAGRVMAQSSGDDTGRDLSSRPYIQALQQGAPTVWTGGLEGIETGQVTVAFGRPVIAADGSTRAFVVVAFYPINLRDRFVGDAPAGGNVVLIDQGGKLLFATAPPAEGSGGDLRGSPLVTGPLAGQGVDFESERTAFDADERFGTIVPIPTMKWAVGYTRSQEALDSSLTRALGA